MTNLDDPEQLRSIDPGDMYGAIFEFPDQIRKAVDIGNRTAVDNEASTGLKNIIICGMGGSAIAGDLSRSMLADSLSIPMYICRDYDLPGFAGRDSLVIGSSYSGDTEETLSAFGQAIKGKCRLFVMTTGGRLGEIADSNKIPRAILPKGFQPRAAIGFSFVPLMLFLNKIGLSDIGPDRFLGLADFLETRRMALSAETSADNNQAKQWAKRLHRRIPIIYSGPQLTDAVGTRIKGQICENAKMLAFANQFPEFNHNELVGWKIIDACRDLLKVLILRDREDYRQVAARMNIIKQYLEKDNIEVIEIHSKGKDRLERMFSLIQLGDFISFYLAILNRVDPTPVEPIDFLKNELAKIK